MPTDTERLDAFAAGIGRIASVDAEVRKAAPKCSACGRPDGGVVPGGATPYDAGLVDRERCPVASCPMRAASPLDSSVLYHGAPE